MPREFDSTGDRIRSIRRIHSSDVTWTGLATAVNVKFPTLCCVNRTTPRENQPPVSLSTETKGNARSSLIRTIDLLRREYSDGGDSWGCWRIRGRFFANCGELFVWHHRAPRAWSLPMSFMSFKRTKDNSVSRLESKDAKVGVESPWWGMRIRTDNVYSLLDIYDRHECAKSGYWNVPRWNRATQWFIHFDRTE